MTIVDGRHCPASSDCCPASFGLASAINRIPCPHLSECAVSRVIATSNGFSTPVVKGAPALISWDCEAERLGRFQVDDELELGRLHDRPITAEDAPSIKTSLAVHLNEVRRIAH
jgi:hypothetical protein